MAFNIFKKEKEGKVAATGKLDKKEKKSVRSDGAETKSTPKAAKKSGAAARFLKHAHITENASRLAEANQYVFQVTKNTNKKEITKTVGDYYGVDVVGVNMINVPGKRKRRGKGIAIEPGYRKAIVTIKKGQTIEILPR